MISTKTLECARRNYERKKSKYKKKIGSLEVCAPAGGPCSVGLGTSHQQTRQPCTGGCIDLVPCLHCLQSQLCQLQERLRAEEALNSKYFDCLEQQGLLCGICMEGEGRLR